MAPDCAGRSPHEPQREEDDDDEARRRKGVHPVPGGLHRIPDVDDYGREEATEEEQLILAPANHER